MKYRNNKINLNSFLFCFSSLVVSLASIAQPLLLKRLFDNYDSISIMKEVVLLYGVTIGIIVIFEYLSKISIVNVRVGIKENIRRSIADTIQKDGYTNVTKERESELNVDLNNNIDAFIEEYYLNKLNMVMLLISLIFYGMAISRLDNLMILIIFIPNIITLLIPRMFSKKVSEKRSALIEKNEKYNLKFFDFYSGINILKNLLVTSTWRNKLDDESDKSIDSEKEFGILQSFIEIAIGCISFMGLLLLIAYGVYKVSRGSITIGTLVAAFQFSEIITLPMMNLIISLNTLTSGKEVMKRLKSRYQSSQTTININHEKELQKFETVTFRNLSFSYNTESIIDIESCVLKRGDKILITGENGCGKSTLMKLITKEVEGYSGEVLINGVELRDIAPNEINGIFNFLHQENHIFQTSIENNIKLYTDIDINDFPQILSLIGYDEISKNDETSQSLSGGEKQRISFMRAMIRDKEVLIIDEALNQIQQDIRNDIIKWLATDKDLTLFYISHDHSEIAEYFNVNIMFEDKKVHIQRGGKEYV